MTTSHSELGFFEQVNELACAYRKYDPATSSLAEIYFLYPGFRAWVLHQIAHRLYRAKVPFLPRFVSELSRLWNGIDIHPGATIGRRVIMDHGLGIVIGETAEVEEDVIMYQGVTLGGTSLARVKRHPTIKRKCVLGSGAKILGAITIGEGCRVGSNSVVVKDAPPYSTVVGIPGRVVSQAGVVQGQELEHGALPDPVQIRLQQLEARLAALERGGIPQG